MGHPRRLLEHQSGAFGPITSIDDVEYFCTGRDSWSAFDARRDHDDPEALLGRLRRDPGGPGTFEVVYADCSRAPLTYPSLRASRTAFVDASALHAEAAEATSAILRLL